MNVHAPPYFVPPRPEPPAEELGLRAFFAAMRTNALLVWPKAAYEQDTVVARTRLTGRLRVIVNTADAIHHVLVENAANYHRPAAAIRIGRPIVGDGLLLSEGDAWRHQRRAIAPAMTPRLVPMMARHVARATEQTMAQVMQVAANYPVDILATMHLLALEIAARSMFSLEMGRYGATLRRHVTEFSDNLGRPHVLDFILPAAIPSPGDFTRRRFRSRWLALMDEIIEVRLRTPTAADEPRDLFDLLLAVRDPTTGAAFSRAQLRDQMATMIVAGHETTAATLFWSMYLLASSPADQERVAAEVRDVDLSPDGAAEALAKLPFTKAVVNESLRLFPPVFLLNRIARGPDQFADVAVPRGSLILIVPWALQRHRRLWNDPDAFNPSRFFDGRPLAHRYAYMPFGAGPRICIGAQLALTEACLVVATMIQRFHVTMANPRPVLPTAVIVTRPDHAALFRLRLRMT